MRAFVQWPLLAIWKRSGLDCAEKTYSVDCSKIVVSLDFLFTFYQEKSEGGLGANPKGKCFLCFGDFNIENTHYCQNLKTP